MTEQKFETLVRKLERYAKQSPTAYQIHVGALAALGYVYIFSILLVLLALIALLVGGGVTLIVLMAQHATFAMVGLIKLAIPMGIGLVTLISMIVRSLRVEFPAPEGIPVERAQAPRLFAALDEICATLQAPPLHHVLVVDDFNAAIQQNPRFGLLGGHVNYLLLGLPLMEAFSPAQFRSVLAHEIGHLSGNHSRFSGRIYQVRQTWDQMLHTLIHQRHRGVSLFLPFFRWYAPYFAAYSFVLRRGNEYVADRCAAQICGAETTAQSLVMSELKGRAYGQEFWGKLLEQARTQPRMPDNLYPFLQTGLREPSGKEDQWYEDALEERTGLGDTHPSLTDRLAALGFRRAAGGPLDLPRPPLPLPPPVTESAAGCYFGPLGDRLAQTINAQWRQNIADAWTRRHTEARQQQTALDDLDAQAAAGTLTPEAAWERARLTARVHGDACAVPLLAEVVAAQPRHAPANFALGRLLLEENDARGLAYLNAAMAAAPEAVGPACDLISWHLRQQGQTAEAAQYRERGRTHQRTWEAGQKERGDLTPRDKFLYHGLPAAGVNDLRRQLGPLLQVRAAYLVRKQVQYLPERPLYVLGIVPQGMAAPDLSEWLGTTLQFPGETVMIILQGSGEKFFKPLTALKTALIFQR